LAVKEDNLHKHLESIGNIFNDVDRFIGVVDLESHYLYANNKLSKLIFEKNKIHPEDKLTHYDIQGPVNNYAKNFQAEDKLAFSSDKMIKIFGCYHCKGDDWRVVLGGKNTFDIDGKKALFYDYFDVTQTKLRHIGMLLTDSHRKTFHENNWRQVSYILTDCYESLGLTVRQSECLFYLVRGKTASEIAQILFRSKRTIESHIDTLKLKLQCETRSEIISKIFDLKLDTTIPNSVIEHPLEESL